MLASSVNTLLDIVVLFLHSISRNIDAWHALLAADAGAVEMHQFRPCSILFDVRSPHNPQNSGVVAHALLM
jgi:hypothetical protein